MRRLAALALALGTACALPILRSHDPHEGWTDCHDPAQPWCPPDAPQCPRPGTGWKCQAATPPLLPPDDGARRVALDAGRDAGRTD